MQLLKIFISGEGLAVHVTKFRDHVIAIVNNKISKLNAFIDDKTEYLLAVNKKIASYKLEDFKETFVNEESIEISRTKLTVSNNVEEKSFKDIFERQSGIARRSSNIALAHAKILSMNIARKSSI